MTGAFVLVQLWFVAVCVAFPHAPYNIPYDIKTLKARNDGCTTRYVTMTSNFYIAPNIIPVTRTARMTLLVHITPFYNGSTSTSTEIVGHNSTVTAVETPTNAWRTFSVSWPKITSASDTATTRLDLTSIVPETTRVPVAPDTTAVTDTTAAQDTPAVPDTIEIPDTTSPVQNTTTAAGTTTVAWNTPPPVGSKPTVPWNSYPAWNSTIVDKRMVMPTVKGLNRNWNDSLPNPTQYYPTNGPTHGPTDGSEIPPGSRTCEITLTSIATSVQTLPAGSYVITETAITTSTLFDYGHLTPPVYNPGAKTTARPEGPVDIQQPDGPPKTTKGPSRPGEINAPPQAGPANPTATKKVVITDAPGSPNDVFPTPIVTLPGAGPIAIDPSKSVIIIGDKTSDFKPGQQTTINDVPISFDSSAGFVVVGGSKTIGLSPITPAPVAPPAVIGGTTIDINQIATQLQPGQVTTIGRDTISRDNSGSFLVIDGTSTVALPQGVSIPRTSVVQVNGFAVPIGELAAELAPGETTVIDGMTISRDNSGLIIGTSTIPLPATTNEIVLGGTTISAGALPSGFSFLPSSVGGGLLLPNGETLMPGSETTINGMEISLMPGETPVAVIEDSISVTATTASDSTSGDETCSSDSMCTQPSRTSAGQTGSRTPASSAEELACAKWRDFVFAGIFVGVFMDWA